MFAATDAIGQFCLRRPNIAIGWFRILRRPVRWPIRGYWICGVAVGRNLVLGEVAIARFYLLVRAALIDKTIDSNPLRCVSRGVCDEKST